MTIDQLREVHKAEPFRPFVLQLADGTRVNVPHPEFLAYGRRGRTVAVATPDGVMKIVGLLLVTAIEIKNGSPRRRRTK